MREHNGGAVDGIGQPVVAWPLGRLVVTAGTSWLQLAMPTSGRVVARLRGRAQLGRLRRVLAWLCAAEGGDRCRSFALRGFSICRQPEGACIDCAGDRFMLTWPFCADLHYWLALRGQPYVAAGNANTHGRLVVTAAGLVARRYGQEATLQLAGDAERRSLAGQFLACVALPHDDFAGSDAGRGLFVQSDYEAGSELLLVSLATRPGRSLCVRISRAQLAHLAMTLPAGPPA